LFGAIHCPSSPFGATSGTAIAARVALFVWRASTVVPAGISFRIIIAHSHIARAIPAILLGATLRTTIRVALIIRRAYTNALSILLVPNLHRTNQTWDVTLKEDDAVRTDKMVRERLTQSTHIKIVDIERHHVQHTLTDDSVGRKDGSSSYNLEELHLCVAMCFDFGNKL